jgi:hypothetical protein
MDDPTDEGIVMSSITDGLFNQLQGQPLDQISQKLGLNSAQTQTAIAAALPLLIGALGRNARDPQGAQSLFGALQRDHVGQDPQQVLGSALGGGGQGNEILGHIFGQRQEVAAQGLSSAAGVDPSHANMLLRWLAPVALAYVAKQMYERRQAKSGASAAPAAPTPDVLREELGREEQEITRQGGVGGGLLGAIFDRNQDGKVDFSDLLGLGGGQRGVPPPAPGSNRV